jgi:hypothetical protein
MGTIGFIDPENLGAVSNRQADQATRPNVCSFVLKDKAYRLNSQIDLQARCGFINGGLCRSILKGSLLKDVAESLNQRAVAN